MKKKVLKFGGTSVGSTDRILHAAKIIKKEHDSGNKIIVVVSAMAGKTNELISLSKSLSNNFTKRELDVLLSTGEQVSCALISGALNELGIKAKSFMNWQIPILTEGENNLLVKLINKRNDIVLREELADQEFDETELRKVDVQVTRLRQKIETNAKQPQFIKTIRGKGYKLICDEI